MHAPPAVTPIRTHTTRAELRDSCFHSLGQDMVILRPMNHERRQSVIAINNTLHNEHLRLVAARIALLLAARPASTAVARHNLKVGPTQVVSVFVIKCMPSSTQLRELMQQDNNYKRKSIMQEPRSRQFDGFVSRKQRNRCLTAKCAFLSPA